VATNKILEQWREGRNEKPSDDILDPPGDSFEEPSGDGRSSRHQVFGLQLIDARKAMIFIPYASILFGEGEFNGHSFRIEFARGDQLWQAEIRGSVNLQYIVDKLTSGKRESCRVNGTTLEEITWRQVVEPEE
jgi:hypothetical protein